MSMTTLAHGIGTGLLAGVVGTAAMTLSSTIEMAGLGRRSAGIAHLAAMWGSALVLLPTLDVAPPVTMWDRRKVAIDL